MDTVVNIFWFRRDLRLNDNAGLFHALKAGKPILPVFVFDTDILDKLEDKADKRVTFIHAALEQLQQTLTRSGSTLHVIHDTPLNAFKMLQDAYNINAVFTNHDYEPYARERDEIINEFLKANNIEFIAYKDQVIFEKNDILKDNGEPYTVFTPYSKKWRASLTADSFRSFAVEKYLQNFLKREPIPIPTLKAIGFEPGSFEIAKAAVEDQLFRDYKNTRDYPGIIGTSRLSVQLRFGTISLRELAAKANQLSQTYLNELIWREFYQMILWHFPQVGKGQSFKPAYDNIEWRHNEEDFSKWCTGETGYPIVDAGMRELNTTGFMHNRVRMVTASFLCKHLLLDWRWGEAYFAEKLLDFELASNNGGWQWASGSGCDSAPYFRIFNPYLQTKKFDPEFKYINKWVPEFQEFTYPSPIVDHEFARKRCLDAYAKALRKEDQ